MNKNFLFFFVGLAFLTIVNSCFIVDQWKQAIIFQFGEAIKTVEEPGLTLKVPFLQNVRYFDKRVLNYNLNAEEIQAQDKKRVIVSAYVKFKIVDALKFYQSIGLQSEADNRLHAILDSSLRQVIGQSPLINLLSKERLNIMTQIEDILSTKSERFGLGVVDVRILRADLPKENSEAIYRRMQSDRVMEAREYRAQGAEESDKIKSAADKEAKIISANAYKQSQILKGEGDAYSTKIYADAYMKDPEFYDFSKSLNVYKTALHKDDTKFVLSPKSEFMKFFNSN